MEVNNLEHMRNICRFCVEEKSVQEIEGISLLNGKRIEEVFKILTGTSVSGFFFSFSLKLKFF